MKNLQKKNQIYFSINGLGFGHSSRNHAIIQRLLKEKFSVYISTYDEGYTYFSSFYNNVFNCKSFKLIFNEEGILSFKKIISYQFFTSLPILLLHILIELRNLLKIKPNLVISDSRISAILASKILKIKSFVILNQLFIEIPRIKKMSKLTKFIKRISERILYEILFFIWKKANYILIPDLNYPYTISKKNIKIKKSNDMKKIKFIGNIFKNEKIINYNKNEKIIICINILSGVLQEKLVLLRKFINILKNIKEKDIKIKVFTGLKFIKHFNLNENEIFGWIKEKEKIFKEISCCKILILTGGHSTILEAIKYKKPILFILLKGHTEKINNAKVLKEMGCAEYLLIDELTKEKLFEKISIIIKNYKYYEENLKKINERIEKNKEICLISLIKNETK